MKKVLCSIFIAIMLLGITACGSEKAPELPEDAVVKGDVQEYIVEMLDENAKIDIFEKSIVEQEGDNLVITCNVLYSSAESDTQNEFVLTYAKEGKEWVLSKCRVNLEEEVSEEDTKETAKETKKEEKDTKDKSTDVKMSDNLSDFTFELDGILYQLPFEYTELKENGWTISSTGYSEDKILDANSYDYFSMLKDGSRITVHVINMSGNSKTIKDCKIGGIEVYCNDLIDTDIVKFANDITVISSLDDVINAYGDANSTNTYDDYTNVSYKYGDYSDVNFSCYDETIKYNYMRMRNYISDESDVTETSSEVPEYLSEYEEPSELGDDLKSCNVELEGDLYHLPTPVSVFTDNGWKITSKSNGVGSGNTDSITMEKNGNKVSFTIKNFADYQTIPENCAVVSFYAYANYDKISVKFPGNITFDSSKTDAEALITEDFAYYKGTNNYSYDFSNYDQGISIGIDIGIESEKVEQLSISAKEWLYE